MIDHLLPIHGNVLVIEPACKAGIVRPKPSMVFRPVIERGPVLIHPRILSTLLVQPTFKKNILFSQPIQPGVDYLSDPDVLSQVVEYFLVWLVSFLPLCLSYCCSRILYPFFRSSVRSSSSFITWLVLR